ncbi:GNAT family N-acetyltransferase [Jeotgalibaca caeni]|uniref:GNAT family N-acetyltransferase n=1 Tax=Jeotgalibaca caeni TaxID=3028623 RepID=UPI00237E7226|nr:GNAT family N-acetyltransferase [Jeotgalibaca caeni]MDE1549270.1 GNAT family N-acetyltransferase [Jeotgalibaca caeni]
MNKQPTYRIVSYESSLEDSWIRCKALSYLYSRFNDQIEPKKDTYTSEDGYSEALELVALNENNEVIGILDIGIFDGDQNKSYPYVTHLEKGSYMDIIAVHPDYQKMGIAQNLITEALNVLRSKRIDYLAIFTRDDEAANNLYKKLGATLLAKNHRVKGTPKEMNQSIGSFVVNKEAKKIEVSDSEGNELPYVYDSGYYWVYNPENVELFDIEDCMCENSYVLYL